MFRSGSKELEEARRAGQEDLIDLLVNLRSRYEKGGCHLRGDYDYNHSLSTSSLILIVVVILLVGLGLGGLALGLQIIG